MATADQISAAIERAGPTHSSAATFRDIRLAPVMAAIETGGTHGMDPAGLRLPLCAYSPEKVFPVDVSQGQQDSNPYEHTWDSLLQDIARLELDEPVQFVNSALSILEKHLWSVPSATNVDWPDISLFDHSRTTAAIAVSLLLAEDPQVPFLLVGGDFGGIQKYIARFEGHYQGLARALRGRSFQVSAFSDHVALAILHQLQLPMTQLVMHAGGHFTLLLPNNAQATQAITNVRERTHKWIHERRFGEMSFALASATVTRAQLKQDFAQVSAQLQDHLQDQKLSGLESLRNTDGWATQSWLLEPSIRDHETQCPACRRRPIETNAMDGEVNLCSVCFSERSTGRKLVRSFFLQYYLGDQPDADLPMARLDLAADVSRTDRHADIVLDFRGSDASAPGKPLVSKLRNHYVPRNDDGSVMEFEDMALQSQGTPHLGYLKADVDNLGFIFARGIRAAGDGQARASISRIATLSRTLEYFFSGYMYYLLENEFPHVYTVFSGGDDLLLVGPWDMIFRLADRLHDQFARYACDNTCWGVSCSIVVEKPRTPVALALEAADRLLERSKNYPGKNAITALDLTMPWSDYKRALAQADQVSEWVRNGIVQASQLRRLLQYGEELEAFQRTGNTTLLRVVPQMIYDLKRNWPDKTPEQNEAKRWACQFTNPEHTDLRLLRFISQFAIYKCR